MKSLIKYMKAIAQYHQGKLLAPQKPQHYLAPPFPSLTACRNIGLTVGTAGAIALGAINPVLAAAPVGISSLNATYDRGTSSSYSTTVANPCSKVNYTCGAAIAMQFGVGATNDQRLSGFVAGGQTYTLQKLADRAALRRKNNAVATGQRHVVFFESGSSKEQLRSSYATSMEELLLNDTINRGTDNVFANTSSAVNSNNIERVDFIAPGGISVPGYSLDNVGFLILERGGNDPFKIAAITSIDANGNPTGFGSLVSVATNNWGKPGDAISTTVMRREETETHFRPSARIESQSIGGIYFPLSSLGVNPGQTIYGYAIFPNDAGSDLVGLSDFPTNTSDASGFGGLDLMAGGGIFFRSDLTTLSGILYQDSDGGDDLDSGESTLPAGITVKLINPTNNSVIATTTTDADGNYTFTGVANGTYQVQIDTSDTDIPAGLTLGTPENLAITVAGSPVVGQNFGFDAATDGCNLGGGTPDTAIAPYISPEVKDNVIATRKLVDTLDDPWRAATGGSSSGTVQPWFGTTNSLGSANSFTYLDPSTSSRVNASVELVHVNISGSTDCAGTANTSTSNSLLSTSPALQDTSPRPASLYNGANQPAFWNQTIASGNDGRRFAARFTFDQPVKSFGAWFGDLETRTANGTPAVLRLLDASGNRIGHDIAIEPTTIYDKNSPDPEVVDQAQCGSLGCGNASTRWVGFVDDNPTPRVSQVLVIVGDDDFNDDGDTEILSFIGANTIPVASNPNLLLVKRITAINGVESTNFVDDPTSTDDNAPNWPVPASTYLRGEINGTVMPGDEVEYTIYFLSTGGSDITNVKICDLIPTNTTFVPTAFNSLTPTEGGLPESSRGIALALSSTSLPANPTVYLTNTDDNDRGQFFAPGTSLPVACSGSNSNGAVIVNVVTAPNSLPPVTAPGTPANSYGFIRFRTRVN